MSAMSLRQAWIRGSSGTEGPSSAILLSVLEEDSPFLGCAAPAGAFLLLDIPFEALKELLPYAGLRNEDVAAVRLIADAAQIAERPQRIQGARDHGLRHAEDVGQAADRMGSRGQVDEHEQRHLPVGKIGLPRPDIADQRLHPAPESTVRHWVLLQYERSLFRLLNQSGRVSFLSC